MISGKWTRTIDDTGVNCGVCDLRNQNGRKGKVRRESDCDNWLDIVEVSDDDSDLSYFWKDSSRNRIDHTPKRGETGNKAPKRVESRAPRVSKGEGNDTEGFQATNDVGLSFGDTPGGGKINKTYLEKRVDILAREETRIQPRKKVRHLRNLKTPILADVLVCEPAELGNRYMSLGQLQGMKIRSL